jgi:hypothetical protein
MDHTATIAHAFLLYGILPLWILAGVGDYLCHRATFISTTSGIKESLIHWLMIIEIGIPILLGLFFQINALIIAIMMLALVLHYITGLWDLTYAYQSPRDIRPVEQHIHSYQEMLPLAGFAFVILLHWKQCLALFGLGTAPADFSFIYKATYWESGYAAWLIIAVICFVFLPYAEEFLRCLRHRKS